MPPKRKIDEAEDYGDISAATAEEEERRIRLEMLRFELSEKKRISEQSTERHELEISNIRAHHMMDMRERKAKIFSIVINNCARLKEAFCVEYLKEKQAEDMITAFLAQINPEQYMY